MLMVLSTVSQPLTSITSAHGPAQGSCPYCKRPLHGAMPALGLLQSFLLTGKVLSHHSCRVRSTACVGLRP